MSARRPRPPSTGWSLLAVVAGLAGGATFHRLDPALARALVHALEPLGTLWTNALRMIVLPLVLASLVVAIAGSPAGRGVGRLSGLAVGVFAALLAVAAAYTLLLAPPLVRGFAVAPATVAALGHAAPAAPGAGGPGFSLAAWLVGLVPVNPFRAATRDDFLPILVFTVPFALAVQSLGADLRAPLVTLFRGLSEAAFTVLHWILQAMPAGILCLTFVLGARTGAAGIGALGWFVAYECALLLGFALVLHALATLAGGARPAAFARAAAPAQLLAVSTRSSLACLPSLIEGAEARLGMAPRVSRLVLPLAASTFKPSRVVSDTAQLLFLARLYGVPLGPGQIAAFVVTIALTSPGIAGVPGSGSHASLPAYLAAGIPIEGVMIAGAVDAIPDGFKTLVNATGNLAAAALVARLAPARAGDGTDPAAAAPGPAAPADPAGA